MIHQFTTAEIVKEIDLEIERRKKDYFAAIGNKDMSRQEAKYKTALMIAVRNHFSLSGSPITLEVETND